MRIVLTIVILAFFSTAQSQDKIYDNFTIDTVYLQEIKFKKVVAYKINTVTIVVNYEEYKAALYVFWKRYQESIERVKKSKDKDDIDPDYKARWLVLDSVYTLLLKEVKTKDTIYLSQTIFSRVEMSPLNNFFPNLIEQKRCAIFDESNKLHLMIIRHTGSRIRGPLNGYGGRAYYLPGKEGYFIEATDWVS